MAKKYWIGESDEYDTRPKTWDTYIVYNEDELPEAQHDVAMWMADDFTGELEDEGN